MPDSVKKKAKENYALFSSDPYHPSLRFKRIHSTMPIYSVRISIDYRAVGIVKNNEIIWYWIGGHSDYDKLLSKL